MRKFTMKKRVILASLLSVGMLSAAVTGGALYNANAAESAPSFEIKTTASIRTNAPAGIRFETVILKTEYEALKNGATFGTVVQSKELYEQKYGSVLEIGQAEAVNIPATNWKLSMTDDTTTADIDESLYNQYNAVLVGEKDPVTGVYAGLPEEMYGVELVARSYVTYEGANGAVTEYGANVAIRSIADVAKAAILDTTRTYGDDEYAYFHDITDYVAQQNANTLQAVEVNVTATEINGAVALGTTYGAVKAVYVLGNDTEIAAENWTYAEDGTLTFTADYLKALPYGEYTLKLFTENAVLSLPTTIYGESTLGIERTFGFDKNDTVSQVYNMANVEWLAEYNEAKGVVKVPDQSTGYHSIFNLRSSYTKDELMAWDWHYLEFNIYIESTDASIGAYHEYSTSAYYSWSFPTNQWKTVTVTKSWILNLYNDDSVFYELFSNTGNGLPVIRSNATLSEGTNIYMDYIDFGKYDTVNDFADEATISSIVLNNANQAKTWLTEFEGAKGVAQIDCNSSNSTIYYKAGLTADELAEVDWNALVIRIYVTKDMWTLYNGNASIQTIETGKWTTLTIPLSVISGTKGSYEGNLDGWLSAFVGGNGAPLFWSWGMSDNNPTIYIDYIELAKIDV